MCLAAGMVYTAFSAAAQDGARGDRAGVRDAPASIFPLEPAWTVDLGQPAAAAPGYDAFHAYVPLRDGTLAAIRLRDGETAWTSARRTEFSPAAADGSIIVAAGATLIALRAADAQPLWTREFAAPISAAPLRAAGWLLVSLATGEIAALRAADGRELWRRSLDGPLRVRPSVGGRRLFVPIDDGRLVALDLTAGTLLWERTLGGSPREVLPLDAVFVGATDNHLYRLSPDDGSLHWRWRAGADIVGLPAVDESRLFFTSLDNILWALDRNSGVQQWRRPLPGRPRAGPLIVGRALFVSGVSAHVRTFDRENRPAGRYPVGGRRAWRTAPLRRIAGQGRSAGRAADCRRTPCRHAAGDRSRAVPARLSAAAAASRSRAARTGRRAAVRASGNRRRPGDRADWIRRR